MLMLHYCAGLQNCIDLEEEEEEEEDAQSDDEAAVDAACREDDDGDDFDDADCVTAPMEGDVDGNDVIASLDESSCSESVGGAQNDQLLLGSQPTARVDAVRGLNRPAYSACATHRSGSEECAEFGIICSLPENCPDDHQPMQSANVVEDRLPVPPARARQKLETKAINEPAVHSFCDGDECGSSMMRVRSPKSHNIDVKSGSTTNGSLHCI